MNIAIWFALAWVGGTALILGSLMTVGSLLLWLIPTQKRGNRERSPSISSSQQNYLKLLFISLVLTLSGASLLMLFPFPQG